MKKLTREQLKSRDEIASKLRDRREDLDTVLTAYNAAHASAYSLLEAAIQQYNETMSEAWDAIDEEQTAYNEVVVEANELKAEIIAEIDGYVEERSEKWQEGDKAQAYASWREAFEEDTPESELQRPDEIAVEEPQDLELDIEDAAEQIEQLQEEVEG